MVANADGTASSVTVWKPVATARAIQKTSQALRERLASAGGNSSGGATPTKPSKKKLKQDAGNHRPVEEASADKTSPCKEGSCKMMGTAKAATLAV